MYAYVEHEHEHETAAERSEGAGEGECVSCTSGASMSEGECGSRPQHQRSECEDG